MSRPYDPDLRRRLTAAHDATKDLPTGTSAITLYLDAARVAEQALDTALGSAVAGVLAMAAEQRRATGLNGILGESQAMLALALAVLDLKEKTP